MTEVIAIMNSASPHSRAAGVARIATALMKDQGIPSRPVFVQDVVAEDGSQLRFDRSNARAIAAFISKASAVIIVSSIYQAAYGARLRALLNRLPPGHLGWKKRAVHRYRRIADPPPDHGLSV